MDVYITLLERIANTLERVETSLAGQENQVQVNSIPTEQPPEAYGVCHKSMTDSGTYYYITIGLSSLDGVPSGGHDVVRVHAGLDGRFKGIECFKGIYLGLMYKIPSTAFYSNFKKAVAELGDTVKSFCE